MKNRRKLSLMALLGACFALGVLIDFLFNGVFKIIWIVIYGPAYLAAVKALETQLFRTQWASYRWPVLTIFLAGAVAGHLIFMGGHRKLTYDLALLSTSPITLATRAWPEKLYVISQPLQRALPGLAAGKTTDIPVVLSAVTDYGCIRNFTVESIGGVDVHDDPEASWTWRADKPYMVDERVGPGKEDRWLPWCRIKFY